MRVAVVTEGLPYHGTSGGAFVMRALVDHLLDVGHEVAVLSLVLEAFGDDELDRRAAVLRERGASVDWLRVPEPAAPRNRLQLLGLGVPATREYPHFEVAGDVRARLAAIEADVVLGFDTGTVVCLLEAGARPLFGIPGDPRHLVWLYRLRNVPFRRRLRRGYLIEAVRWLVMAPKLRATLIRVGRSCDGVAMFGAQHARWLRARTGRCLYQPLFATDPGAPAHPAGDRRPIVLLALGGLSSTATQRGLRLLVRRVLPLLERSHADRYELHVAGGGMLDPDLQQELDACRGVVMLGYVPDSAAAAAAADVFLAASPYPVGARTRIVDAFSAGATVVAHDSAQAGIPELSNGENALLAGDGAGLAAAIGRLIDDAGLRRSLGVGARLTYDRAFRPEIALAPLVAELERLAGQG